MFLTVYFDIITYGIYRFQEFFIFAVIPTIVKLFRLTNYNGILRTEITEFFKTLHNFEKNGV